MHIKEDKAFAVCKYRIIINYTIYNPKKDIIFNILKQIHSNGTVMGYGKIKI